MRTEKEMLDLILTTAQNDPRVRAVLMNGSRTVTGASHGGDVCGVDPCGSPLNQGDPFQDFDIIYVVNDMASFRAQPDWIDCFGERMILQLPDEMDAGEEDYPLDQHYGYLMQFMDGNRIDLGIHPIEKIDELYEDSQTLVLLDKDGLLKPFPPASNNSYLVKPPTPRQFCNCCNEFWWVSPYAAKGLWRGQMFYAKHALETYIRPQLDQMVTWYIGLRHNWQVSVGSGGKYIPKYLEPDLWEQYRRSWVGPDEDDNWDALLAMGLLFRHCALSLAAEFGYEYPHQDDRRVSAHLLHVRTLPRDAAEIYPS